MRTVTARMHDFTNGKHPHGRRSDCPADAGSSELVGVGFNVTYFYPRDYWDWVGIEWDLIV